MEKLEEKGQKPFPKSKPWNGGPLTLNLKEAGNQLGNLLSTESTGSTFWDKLDMPVYAVHDYAEAIYKGCNSKQAWSWVASMLKKHYARNLSAIQYADVHKRFYLKVFKDFGLDYHSA